MAKFVVIVGILLAVVLGLLLLLLCLRVGAQIEAQNGKFAVRVRIGPFRKTIEQIKGKKPSERKPPEQKQEKSPEEPESADRPWAAMDWGDLLCELLGFFDDVKDRLRIDILRAHVLLATGDAAKTGLYLGGASALSGMIYPFFAQNFKIKELSVHVDGDFEGNDTKYDLCFACSFRPIRMIAVGMRRGCRLYHMLKQTQSVEAKEI